MSLEIISMISASESTECLIEEDTFAMKNFPMSVAAQNRIEICYEFSTI